MTNKPGSTPAPLPGAMVTVDKGFMREVKVGIVGANRIPSLGFDVSGQAPNHFRMVNHGNFGVAVGSKFPVEVRVIYDGQVLLEKQLLPMDMPDSVDDPRMRAMMAEKSQLFVVSEDGDGKPFKFQPYEGELSPAEQINEQVHARRACPPPPLHQLYHRGQAREELKVDLDRSQIPLLANLPAAESKPAEETQGKPVPAEVAERAMSWAPSHGLVAIGVRMIMQPGTEQEPPTPPDAFSYVMFQLNPFRMHALARAKNLRRVVIPAKDVLVQFLEGEGHGDEVPQVPTVVCHGSCDNHRHNHDKK